MPGLGRPGGRQPGPYTGESEQISSATGVYILLTALVAVAVLPGFDRLGGSEFGAYVIALGAAALAAALALIAVIERAVEGRVSARHLSEGRPVDFHPHRRTVRWSLSGEFAFYGLALAASVLLVLDVVLDGPIVGVLAGLFAATILAVWVIIPWRAVRDSHPVTHSRGE